MTQNLTNLAEITFIKPIKHMYVKNNTYTLQEKIPQFSKILHKFQIQNK